MLFKHFFEEEIDRNKFLKYIPAVKKMYSQRISDWTRRYFTQYGFIDDKDNISQGKVC